MPCCTQTTARRNAIPIDTLSFEYAFINSQDGEGLQPPKEGVYIKVGQRHGGGVWLLADMLFFGTICSRFLAKVLDEAAKVLNLLPAKFPPGFEPGRHCSHLCSDRRAPLCEMHIYGS